MSRVWHDLGLFKRAIVLVVLFMVATTQLAKANSQTLDGEQVVDQFLENLKVEVTADLDEKIQTYVDLKACFENTSCTEAEDIIDKYQEYRIYVGLVQYQDLKMRLQQMSHAYIVHSGVRLYFSKRNDEGREEVELIQQIYNQDAGKGRRRLASLGVEEETREYHGLKRSLGKGRFAYYAGNVSEYLAAFPFFGRLTDQQMTRENALTAINKSGEDYEGVRENVQELGGKEIFELIGFTDALHSASEKLSEEEGKIVANYMEAMNKETQIFGRLYSIFTSWKTLSLAACHISTYALGVIPHPIVQIARLGAGFVCSSIGIGLTVKHLGGVTIDIIRQLEYGLTRNFDQEVLQQFVKSYFTELVMAMVYVVPGLAGLKTRSVAMGKNWAVISRAYRSNKLSLNFRGRWQRSRGDSFAKDMKSMGKSYAQYYGEELAIDLVVAAGGHYAGALANIQGAMFTRRYRSSGRNVSILPYSALLNV